MSYRTINRPGAVVLLLASLSACTPADESGSGPDGEAPFFEANRFGSGPLTLDELKIDIPDEVEAMMNEQQKVCFFDAVARRAEEAGDPSELDPNDHVYWGGNVSLEDWNKHSNHMQRVLLAQGIVSWAMIDCTD